MAGSRTVLVWNADLHHVCQGGSASPSIAERRDQVAEIEALYRLSSSAHHMRRRVWAFEMLVNPFYAMRVEPLVVSATGKRRTLRATRPRRDPARPGVQIAFCVTSQLRRRS